MLSDGPSAAPACDYATGANEGGDWASDLWDAEGVDGGIEKSFGDDEEVDADAHRRDKDRRSLVQIQDWPTTASASRSEPQNPREPGEEESPHDQQRCHCHPNPTLHLPILPQRLLRRPAKEEESITRRKTGGALGASYVCKQLWLSPLLRCWERIWWLGAKRRVRRQTSTAMTT